MPQGLQRLTLVLSVVLPLTLGAQGTPRDSSCDSSALAKPVLAPRTIVGVLRLESGRQEEPRPYVDSLGKRLARAIRLPSPLVLPIFGPPTWAPDDSTHEGKVEWVHPEFDAAVRFTVGADGMLRVARLATSSFNPRVDSALLAAVDEAFMGIDHTVLPLDAAARKALDHDTLAFRYEIGVAPNLTHAKAARMVREYGKDKRAAAWADTIGSGLMLPHYRLSSGPRFLRASGDPLPRTPGTAGEAAYMLLGWVVAPDGSVVPSSVDVILIDGEPAFARAAAAYVRNARYEPARISGCAVPVTISWPLLLHKGFDTMERFPYKR